MLDTNAQFDAFGVKLSLCIDGFGLVLKLFARDNPDVKDIASESTPMDDLTAGFFLIRVCCVGDTEFVTGRDGELLQLFIGILVDCIVIVIAGESFKLVISSDILGGNLNGGFNPGLGRSFGRGGSRRSSLLSILLQMFG